MRTRTDYTVKDSAGTEVHKGDRVTVTFTAEVRNVSRDGYVLLKSPEGTITGWYPYYQKMHKTADSAE